MLNAYERYWYQLEKINRQIQVISHGTQPLTVRERSEWASLLRRRDRVRGQLTHAAGEA